jgi:hypothetical protein
MPPANNEERESPLKAVTRKTPAMMPTPMRDVATSVDLRFMTYTPE